MSRSHQKLTASNSTDTQTTWATAYRVAGVVMLLGAVVLWVSSRCTWVTLLSEDDKAGSATLTITGASWSAELTVCVLLFFVAGISVFPLGKLGRRIMGVAAAFVAVFAMITPVTLLASGADPEHARVVLSSDNSFSTPGSSSALHPWAVLSSLEVASLPLLSALFALLLVLAGACLLIWRPGRRHRDNSRFTRKSSQTAIHTEEELDEPDSGRALWDALDSGRDPTADISEAPKGEAASTNPPLKP